MKYISGVSTLLLDESKCINCMKCIEVCPRSVLAFNGHIFIRDLDACIECGGCQMNCVTSAITVNAGVGCASAIITGYLKKVKFLNRFIKDGCC